MASLAQHNAGQKLPGIFWYSIILSQGKYGLGWTRNMNTCIYWRRIFVIYMHGKFNDKHIVKCNPALWYVSHIYLFVGIIQKIFVVGSSRMRSLDFVNFLHMQNCTAELILFPQNISFVPTKFTQVCGGCQMPAKVF